MSKRFFTLILMLLVPVGLILLLTVITAKDQDAPRVADVADAQKFVPNGIWSDLPALPTVSLNWGTSQVCEGNPSGGNSPLRLKRAGAVAYPPNGKIYILGGRHRADGDDIHNHWIWEYTPGAGSYVRKNATLDDCLYGARFLSNMAVAVLTDTSGVRIYAIGGSSVDSLPTNRVRVYDPVADTDTILTGDAWPATPQRIPGGYAVYNNKLYIFGGNNPKPTSQHFSDTWVFDPMGTTGNKWTQLAGANLSVARSAIAGAALDGYIYAIGGEMIAGSTVLTVTQSAVVERLDPNNPGAGWQSRASLPYPRGDMGAWAYDTSSGYEIAGRILVAGGNYPVPDNQAYLYNASANSWSFFPNMLRARRNYAYTQWNGILYAFGGYNYSPAITGVYDGSNDAMRYDASGPPSPPGITPTNTPIPSPTSCYADTNYTYSTTTGAAIVPGTTLVPGTNNCQDCIADLTLPFPFTLYGQTFTSALVGVSGHMQFGSNNTTWLNNCLPNSLFSYTMLPYWDNMTMTGAGMGVYTSISGSAPNRIFNIEWRTAYYNAGGSANFEIRLYEADNSFEYIYGTISQGSTVSTIGVQRDMTYFTQASCNAAGIVAGTKLTWSQPTCSGSTPVPTGTPTNTPTNAPTNTSTNTSTNTPTRTNTSIPTNTPTGTFVPPTNTRTNTATRTSTTVPTNTAPPAATDTPVPPTVAGTIPPTITTVPTQIPCTASFSDVPLGHTFYPFIMCLACQGIINGYDDSTFRPHNNVTRGQITKIVANSAGFDETPDPGLPTFEDVPPASTFWVYIERLANYGIMSGYPCGGPGEPCVPPFNRPYFRPNANATRGQIAKIIANSAGFNDEIQAGTQTFEDVEEGSTFHTFIEQLLLNRPGAMSGYPCGSPGEACIPPDNRPYFRPSANATRGQVTKMVHNVFFPNCVAPVRVRIKDFGFSPVDLAVVPGTTVRFINRDPTWHTATANDLSWDTGRLDMHQFKDILFAAPGSYPYYCDPHSFMTATITVGPGRR